MHASCAYKRAITAHVSSFRTARQGRRGRSGVLVVCTMEARDTVSTRNHMSYYQGYEHVENDKTKGFVANASLFTEEALVSKLTTSSDILIAFYLSTIGECKWAASWRYDCLVTCLCYQLMLFEYDLICLFIDLPCLYAPVAYSMFWSSGWFWLLLCILVYNFTFAIKWEICCRNKFGVVYSYIWGRFFNPRDPFTKIG